LSTRKAVHVRISGKVQHVGYRMWVAARAMSLGLDGWTRNRIDGTVEAVFAGDAAVVDQMVEACWKGSPLSAVSDVHVEPTFEELALHEGKSGFYVLMTA
jgi:acylphosphatase